MRAALIIVFVVLLGFDMLSGQVASASLSVGGPLDQLSIMKPQRCLRHCAEVNAEFAELTGTQKSKEAETPSALRGDSLLKSSPSTILRVILPKDSVKADTLVALAKTQLGKNYCYAVSNPDKGFDCSGFVYYVFHCFNIEVPRSSKLYKNYGQKIELDSARAGDVIVFTGTNARKRSPGHVGIVIKNENGVPTFIHSSSGKKKGVIISDFNESPYYKKRFIKIVRVAVVY